MWLDMEYQKVQQQRPLKTWKTFKVIATFCVFSCSLVAQRPWQTDTKQIDGPEMDFGINFLFCASKYILQISQPQHSNQLDEIWKPIVQSMEMAMAIYTLCPFHRAPMYDPNHRVFCIERRNGMKTSSIGRFRSKACNTHTHTHTERFNRNFTVYVHTVCYLLFQTIN